MYEDDYLYASYEDRWNYPEDDRDYPEEDYWAEYEDEPAEDDGHDFPLYLEYPDEDMQDLEPPF